MNILNDFKFGKNIIGVDEVGRGCLAGPVFAAAIKLDEKNFPSNSHIIFAFWICPNSRFCNTKRMY